MLVDFEFLNLLIGKFLVDLDFILLCINEVGIGIVLLLLSELDWDVLIGFFWFWFWLFWVVGGGGIRVLLFCFLCDFFNFSNFCISLGDIWWVFFGFVGKGSVGIRERFGIEVIVLFLLLIGLSWGLCFVLILFGNKNFFWVLVLWCVWWNIININSRFKNMRKYCYFYFGGLNYREF